MNNEITVCENSLDSISTLSGNDLMNEAVKCFDLPEEMRPQTLFLLSARAKQLSLGREFASLVKAFEKINRKSESRDDSDFIIGNDGEIVNTIGNYATAIRTDFYFTDLRYNQMTKCPVWRREGEKEIVWTDNDLSKAIDYIERKYHIRDRANFADALNIVCSERAYHPIRELVDSLKWDGTERITQFLTKIMKADDTEYSHEVSRLIFAGGISRLYDSGCKFDIVPVLIGSKQGEGKSTIVRWLALKDDYFSEVNTFENSEAVECIEGAWICEIAELLALKRAKDVEGVKAFLTRQIDKYRKPYAKSPESFPRSCIFIATTNNEQFLADKTGNRRFFPIKVNSKGRDLFDNEEVIKEYIRQCWAEARVLFDKKDKMIATVADHRIEAAILANQEEAVEDDPRIGIVGRYLERKRVGDYVCTQEIWERAICKDSPNIPAVLRKDSYEVSLIMRQFPEWQKSGAKRFEEYGVQKAWKKTGTIEIKNDFEI